MAELRAELNVNPPLPGVYVPKKGDLCVAKFVDDLWYRARIEKVAHCPLIPLFSKQSQCC